MSRPVMTLRWEGFDADEYPVEVLWTAPNYATEQGDRVLSLMTVPAEPGMGYVIAQHAEFVDGQTISTDDFLWPYISLGRPDAGQLALALITALINNSDQLIDSYAEEIMALDRLARRSNPPSVTA